MKPWSQEIFNEFILKHKVIGFFPTPILFKHGRLCQCYVNWRGVSESVLLTEELVSHLIAFVGHLGLAPQCFYGVPEGGTKLALLSQYLFAKSQPDYQENKYPFVMGRGKPKDHGDPRVY